MSRDIFYRRHLPHFQPYHATYFITYRIANSLPSHLIKELKNDYKKTISLLDAKLEDNERLRLGHFRESYFAKFDAILDGSVKGPRWLINDKVAKIVAESISYLDGKDYDLHACCVMPNHVHMLIETTEDELNTNSSSDIISTANSNYPLTKTLQNLKKFSAKEANKVLKRNGQFWHHESYDHAVRNSEEFAVIVNYIIQNPVKAGLVKLWKEWKWTYCKNEDLLYSGTKF